MKDVGMNPFSQSCQSCFEYNSFNSGYSCQSSPRLNKQVVYEDITVWKEIGKFVQKMAWQVSIRHKKKKGECEPFGMHQF